MRLTFRAVDDRGYNISHLRYNKSHRQFRHVRPNLCAAGIPPAYPQTCRQISHLGTGYGTFSHLRVHGVSLFTLLISHLRGTLSLTFDTSTLTPQVLTC